MGYNGQLLIVRPDTWIVEDGSKVPFLPKEGEGVSKPLSKSCVMWQLEAVLSLGQVTRLEKLTDPRCNLEAGSKKRAAICVMDVLFSFLVDKQRTGNRNHLAPPFTLPDECNDGDEGLALEWEREKFTYELLVDDSQFVRVPLGLLEGQVPSIHFMKEHNRRLNLPDEKLAYFLQQNHNFILDVPFMWSTCGEVVKCLDEMVEVEAWQELMKDAHSLSYFHLWRSNLNWWESLGASVIFCFHHLNVPAIL